MDRVKFPNQEPEGINEIQLSPRIVDLEKFVKSEIQEVSFSNEEIATSSSQINLVENDQAEKIATATISGKPWTRMLLNAGNWNWNIIIRILTREVL